MVSDISTETKMTTTTSASATHSSGARQHDRRAHLAAGEDRQSHEHAHARAAAQRMQRRRALVAEACAQPTDRRASERLPHLVARPQRPADFAARAADDDPLPVDDADAGQRHRGGGR
jgi:hypothetical protein